MAAAGVASVPAVVSTLAYSDTMLRRLGTYAMT